MAGTSLKVPCTDSIPNWRSILKEIFMSTIRKQVQHRDSVDGQFVKKEYANTHKNTTEREVIKHPVVTAPPPKRPAK